MHPARFTLACCFAFLLAGCAWNGPTNPSLSLSPDDAQAELKQMREAPRPLERPVIVIGGWGDVLGLPPSRLAKALRRATGDDRIHAIGMGWIMSFDDCRERVIRHVEEWYPSDDPEWTAEVDVVAFSMGGLVARDAARPADDGGEVRKRLRIARLFDISVPIRGAAWADVPPIGRLSHDMRSDSDFLKALAAAQRDATYETYHYVRLGDKVVGAANAAPPGQTAWWVSNRFPQQAHGHAYKDPRIIADIARRLRGEPAFATSPPAPLPDDTEETASLGAADAQP